MLCQSLLNYVVVLGIIPFCAIVISEVFADAFEPSSTSVMQFIIEIQFTMTPRFHHAFGFVSHLQQMIAYCLEVMLGRLGKFIHIEMGPWKCTVDYLFCGGIKTSFFLGHSDFLDQELISSEFWRIPTHNPLWYISNDTAKWTGPLFVKAEYLGSFKLRPPNPPKIVHKSFEPFRAGFKTV